MWDTLETTREGTEEVKRSRLKTLSQEYEMFRVRPGEKILDLQKRFTHLIALGKLLSNSDLKLKVLRSLTRTWQPKVTAISEKKSLSKMSLISKEEIEQRKQHGYGETVKNKDILYAGYLKLEERLLHYFLSYVILPKFSNHSQISGIELQLMYAINYNIKINWTQMIMRKMWNVRISQSLLPYAIFITKILEYFGVSLDGETKMALNLHQRKIDVEVVHKMGFSLDPVTRRTYRHRTDRPTAPTEQLEPTIPD
ncbi:hypothetical protein Lal_00012370 [Lupinus albus]|nr:hypothetical protein Lal_00012370 [Lupinus albus]